MPTTLATGTSAAKAGAAAEQQAGPAAYAVLPSFEQHFVETIAIAAASAGQAGTAWEHFNWELDVPDVSMAAIAHRSVFGVL